VSNQIRCNRVATHSNASPMAAPGRCSCCPAASLRRDLARPPRTSPAPRLGRPLFVQISDTISGSTRTPTRMSAPRSRRPSTWSTPCRAAALIVHTGDITHLSKPAEFDLAQQMLARLRSTELHTVPGEHDTTTPPSASISTASASLPTTAATTASIMPACTSSR